jgi:hypothetical protein
MDAHQIATLINLTADAVTSGKLPIGEASRINKELWALAGDRGYISAVDGLLQEWSAAQMQDAVDALPQDGSVAI